MLKNIVRYFIVAFGISTILMGISCNNDDDISTEVSVYYKDRTKNIDDDETSCTIKFTAYTQWYVTIDTAYSDWLSVNATYGSSGSYELTCYTTMNDSSESRTGVIVFHGDSQTAKANIVQAGYEIIKFKDAAFEQYCIDNFDVDGSGYVTSREAHLATEIDCPNSGIADLSSIGYFKYITKIDVSGNPIKTLSLTQNTELTKIYCQDCPVLEGLELGDNVKSVQYLDCSGCTLTSLTLDSCTLITTVNCRANDLKSLDVTNNQKLTSLDVTENYNMTSLFMEEDQTIRTLKKEETTRIVYPSEIITVPDAEFQKYLLEQFDVNRDNKIDVGEAEAVRYIRCQGKEGVNRPIYSLEGIEYFPNITEVDCSWCMLSNLDLQYNAKLQYIYCHNNADLQNLAVSTLSPLIKLHCFNCQSMTSLNLNRNTHLSELLANNCSLNEIDLTQCNSLSYLNISGNKLQELSITENGKINYIDCSYNNIQGVLTIKNCDSLAYLMCYNNDIDDIDIDTVDIIGVDISNNNISRTIDLASCEYLRTFACDSNKLDTLILPKSGILEQLNAKNNNLKVLNLDGQEHLLYAEVENNAIDSISTKDCNALQRVNLRSNKLKREISFSANRGLQLLWLDQNPELETVWVPKGIEHFEYVVDEGVVVKER